MISVLFKCYVTSLALAFICYYQSEIKDISQSSAIKESGKVEMQPATLRRRIPDLIGLKLSDAIEKLRSAKLNIGIIVADDSLKTIFLSELRVFLQNPKPLSETTTIETLKRGEQVDIWVTDNQQKIDSVIRNKVK